MLGHTVFIVTFFNKKEMFAETFPKGSYDPAHIVQPTWAGQTVNNIMG